MKEIKGQAENHQMRERNQQKHLKMDNSLSNKTELHEEKKTNKEKKKKKIN